ncbi:hypothetical protein ACIBM3_32600 [Rhodococcus erythropolis]
MKSLLLIILSFFAFRPLVEAIAGATRSLRATRVLNNMDLRANPTSGL